VPVALAPAGVYCLVSALRKDRFHVPLAFGMQRFWKGSFGLAGILVGFVLLLLAATTHYFVAEAFVSLWCFFAAILSLYLCHYFYQMPAAAGATAVN